VAASAQKPTSNTSAGVADTRRASRRRSTSGAPSCFAGLRRPSADAPAATVDSPGAIGLAGCIGGRTRTAALLGGRRFFLRTEGPRGGIVARRGRLLRRLDDVGPREIGRTREQRVAMKLP